MQLAAIDIESLKSFTPLGRLGNDDAKELLATSVTKQLPAGTTLFNSQNKTKQVYFLLDGEIELTTADNQTRRLKADNPEAKTALSNTRENQKSARTLTDVTLLCFDADMLELFLSWSDPISYQVNEIQQGLSGEWLDRLLQSRGLLRFSEEHIQNLLEHMTEIHANAGDVIIQQDDNDQYYYIIKNGRCSVSRKPSPASKEIKLAELNEGDAFGEEALLSDAARNATITMEEEGDLMRLSKKDFSTLLAKPLLSTVSWDEGNTLLKMGGALLDIRLPTEFEKQHLPGSINLPLSLLRLKLKQLSHHRKYIIYCNDGSQSTVAAFLLNRHGFDAFILDGGLHANQQLLQAAAEPPVEEKNEPVATEAKKVDKNRLDSFADFWGSTIEEIQEQKFNDSHDEDFAKTKPIKSKIVTKAISNPAEFYASDPKTKAAPVKAVIPKRKPKSRMTSSFVALLVLGIATYAAMDQAGLITPKETAAITSVSPPETVVAPISKQENVTAISSKIPAKVAPTPAPVAIAPEPVEVMAPSNIEETTPWINEGDNSLNELLLNESDFEEPMPETSPAAPSTANAEPKQALDPATRGFINP